MKSYISLFLLFLVACASCGNKSVNNKAEEIQADTLKKITMPTMPSELKTPELRADYLVDHYWDHVNFADTNYIHHPEITEQAWVDYIDILRFVSPAKASAGIKKLFGKAGKEKKVYLYFVDLADKYLYDPNSPMRNEEMYIAVLDTLLGSSVLNDTEKIRPQGRRDLAQRNRLGTKAIDFAYTLASGKEGTLYGINSPYTILFFNNPGCHACAETIEALKNAPAIKQAISQKQATILSIYPDKELEEWKQHRGDFPAEWINSYDRKQVIMEKNRYDLKAIPTLYLLDKNKIVLLKDATAPEIEQYLSNHSNH